LPQHLTLVEAHSASKIVLPDVSTSLELHTHEPPLTMGEIDTLSTQGRILEVFGVNTAALVMHVSRIAWKGEDNGCFCMRMDLVLLVVGCGQMEGPV